MKFHVVSLGCAKNTADSERLIHELESCGGFWVPDPAQADLLLLNTCGFIQDAKEESLREIMRLVQLRAAHPRLRLIVFGCLVKRYRQELHKDIPEVDLFLEFIEPAEIPRLFFSGNDKGPRKASKTTCDGTAGPECLAPPRLTPPHIGILKVAEGCDNRCAYCAIPDIRGPFRSRSLNDIREDLDRLIGGGAREISVVAQDPTRFGEDTSGSCQLPEVCRIIGERPEVSWIRLHYLHPARLSAELLDRLFHAPKVLPYFDIPFQHVSDPVLEGMGRHVTNRDLLRLLGHIRRRWRRAVVRTTFLVGFPGETEEDFSRLLAFLELHPLDRVGAFAYSPEDGTPAATRCRQVPVRTKSRRLDELMTLQQVLAAERNQRRWVGKRTQIMVDEIKGNEASGRTFGDAWQVDNLTHIRYDGSFSPGDLLTVRILEADAYDLQAELEP